MSNPMKGERSKSHAAAIHQTLQAKNILKHTVLTLVDQTYFQKCGRISNQNACVSLG